MVWKWPKKHDPVLGPASPSCWLPSVKLEVLFPGGPAKNGGFCPPQKMGTLTKTTLIFSWAFKCRMAIHWRCRLIAPRLTGGIRGMLKKTNRLGALDVRLCCLVEFGFLFSRAVSQLGLTKPNKNRRNDTLCQNKLARLCGCASVNKCSLHPSLVVWLGHLVSQGIGVQIPKALINTTNKWIPEV